MATISALAKMRAARGRTASISSANMRYSQNSTEIDHDG